MSFKHIADLSGSVPELGLGGALLTNTYSTIESVKIYQQQCRDVCGRCVTLMISLRDWIVAPGSSKTIELADYITTIIRRIDRKVNEWADYSQLQSFLRKQEIKDGIDRLHRDIDATFKKFNIHIDLDQIRRHKSDIIQERDREEIRDVLYDIVSSVDIIKILLHTQPSECVDDIMESLQTELHHSISKPGREKAFRDGLWLLHEQTSKLPPLVDLTGQVLPSNNHTVPRIMHDDMFLGDWLDKELVIMRLIRALSNDLEFQNRFEREVITWRYLNHVNVVSIYGVIYSEKDMYYVSPYMHNGTAIKHVQNDPKADRLQILSEVACGLEYLHLNGIIHGDLRGANVMISKEGVARLHEFGLTKFLEDHGQGLSSVTGVSPRWLAPELFRKSGHLSTYSDVWSFGMVCLELMTGEQPFSGIPRDITVLRELDHGRVPDRPGRHRAAQGLTDDLWSLMRKCWNKKPEGRPSMTDVKSKLLEIRGAVASPPGGSIFRPKRRVSLFSLHRPSTPNSEVTSSSGSSSGHRLNLPVKKMLNDDSIIEEPADIARISLKSSGNTKRTSFSARSFHSDEGITRSNLLHPRSPGFEALETSTSLKTPSGVHFPLQQDRSSPTPNAASFNSNFHISESQREAAMDRRATVNFSRSGSVSSGTLEGLVEHLINYGNLGQNFEYRHIFLMTYTDFTVPEDLFGILARRFNSSEIESQEEKTALQFNILAIIIYWLSSKLTIDTQLLWQMKSFCVSIHSIDGSSAMNSRTREILGLIDERSNRDLLNSPVSLMPGRKMPRTSDILPRDLAIALTLLEGDKYKSILPADYIAHLRRHPGHNNIETVYLTNNKIVLWVKQSILHYDAIESRVEVLKFFVNAAQECRKFRNFASMTAICNALHSAPIDRLRLTKKELTQPLRQRLEELGDVLDPTSNHRTYRAALHEVSDPELKSSCVPWVAVHLRELQTVLQQYPPTVKVGGRPLINFERYIKFTDRIKDVLHYSPPDLEHYRPQGQLAYLEYQLRGVHVNSNVEDDLMERSMKLEVDEAIDYTRRKRELKSLGFRT